MTDHSKPAGGPGPEAGPTGKSRRTRPGAPARDRGRVDILLQKSGRSGKTVTVVTHFRGIGLLEKQELARRIQKACGAGGTVKEGRIEIQGEQRAAVARLLAEAGFRPVLAGG